MAEFHALGTCTIKLGPTGSGTDFAGEFIGVKITHTYEDIGEKRTMLDGSERNATRKRSDGLTGNVENDLTAAGLYKFLMDSDLEDVDIEVTHTDSGAKWVGAVTLSLPADIGADEYGAPIVSSVEWQAVGALAFTPGTAAAA